ncbi:unnamed protein product [Merluccius merluccius]
MGLEEVEVEVEVEEVGLEEVEVVVVVVVEPVGLEEEEVVLVGFWMISAARLNCSLQLYREHMGDQELIGGAWKAAKIRSPRRRKHMNGN